MSLSDFDFFQEKPPVMGILRGVSNEVLSDVLSVSVDAGLKFIEVTLNTKRALALIESAANEFSKSIVIGAGTVLSLKEAESAYGAGARFIVSPTLNVSVSEFCQNKNLPYFPGAFTPTEIETAWNSGASMVKVFPASQVGPKYFKEIKGPFNHIPLMAVGGVRADNVVDFFKAGASAIAVGASIFSTTRMDGREFSSIKRDLQDILIAVREFSSRLKK
ncbi:MAG: bifunctional 4-hydroxy-2-oxoglutarate aldolase/2-dehydro-3-deoxy-phosphogluconate aldolase [Nitrospinales bacterium]